MSESFKVNLTLSGSMVLEKIFKYFSYLNTCKNGFPYCGPNRPPGGMILTILIMHYIRKFQYKFDFFRLSGSQEKDI
jgi:hypothetical protein